MQLRSSGGSASRSPSSTGVGAVVGEDVVAAVLDAGRERVELVEHRRTAGRDAGAARGRRRVGGAGEGEEVGALVRVEQQGAGERVEHLLGDLDVAGLLEPGVPGDADAGELGDLLAAQARRAPAAAAGRPTCSGVSALAAAAQEGGELARAGAAAWSGRAAGPSRSAAGRRLGPSWS